MSSVIAILDIGTNTITLLIARLHSPEKFTVLSDDADIVRLGEGIHTAHAFLPAAMDRTYDALERMATKIHDAGCDAVHAVGTAAFRHAANAQEFIQRVQDGLGITIHIISGDEEARLIALAAKADFSHLSRPLVVMDIGGGSTEFIMDDGTRDTAISLPFGSVKLTERFIQNDPPHDAEIDALCSYLQNEMTQLPRVDTPSVHLVACAGTATSLATLHLGLADYDAVRVHGSRISHAGLVNVITRLRALPFSERSQLPGLSPLRADVIIAGAHILLEAMDYYGTAECIISDRGLRYGVLRRELSKGADLL